MLPDGRWWWARRLSRSRAPVGARRSGDRGAGVLRGLGHRLVLVRLRPWRKRQDSRAGSRDGPTARQARRRLARRPRRDRTARGRGGCSARASCSAGRPMRGPPQIRRSPRTPSLLHRRRASSSLRGARNRTNRVAEPARTCRVLSCAPDAHRTRPRLRLREGRALPTVLGARRATQDAATPSLAPWRYSRRAIVPRPFPGERA